MVIRAASPIYIMASSWSTGLVSYHHLLLDTPAMQHKLDFGLGFPSLGIFLQSAMFTCEPSYSTTSTPLSARRLHALESLYAVVLVQLVPVVQSFCSTIPVNLFTNLAISRLDNMQFICARDSRYRPNATRCGAPADSSLRKLPRGTKSVPRGPAHIPIHHSTMSSSVHQAIALPEILDLICLHLEKPELARFGRSSHYLFHPAVRCLWGLDTIDDTRILSLLPGTTIEKNESGIAKFEVTTPAVFSDAYFERFNLYAPYVKQLRATTHWSQEEDYYNSKHLPGWSSIIDYAGTRDLLPNLKKVLIREDGPGGTSSLACVNWLSVLIPSSLPDFDVFKDFQNLSIDSGHQFARLVDTVMSKCSSDLRRVKLALFEPAPPTRPLPVTPSTEDLPVLPDLSPRKSLLCKALERTAAMPRLENLKLLDLDVDIQLPTNIVYTPQSFNALRYLTTSCDSVEPLMQLLRTPIAAQLTELNLTTEWPFDKQEAEQLTTLIAKGSPLLTKLTLYLYGIPDVAHLLDALMPLRSLQLESLVIDGVPCTDPPQTLSLRTISEWWPFLQVLEIENAAVSFGDLLNATTYFPRLTCLLMHLPSGSPAELLTEKAPQSDTPPTRELEFVSDFKFVHDLAPADTEMFAEYFARVQRNIQIKCYCRGFKHGPEYEAFKEVIARHAVDLHKNTCTSHGCSGSLTT
ncbi:hypothetical protein BDV93DRAFT_287590 [Ceratobasidium sp. AG-I]|nr:hypothetical protein BDV93DRAFT_287590 [Ceratobasidium sp. AG-I]